jgi:hypothetical protein
MDETSETLFINMFSYNTNLTMAYKRLYYSVRKERHTIKHITSKTRIDTKKVCGKTNRTQRT